MPPDHPRAATKFHSDWDILVSDPTSHYEELVAAARAQIASLQAGQPSDRMTERRAVLGDDHTEAELPRP